MAVHPEAVVLRAGIVTPDSIRKGAERVDTRDIVTNLSVQLTAGRAKQDPATVAALLQYVPNPHYALTFARNILRSGTVDPDPLAANPFHALVSGISVDDLYAIFKVNKH